MEFQKNIHQFAQKHIRKATISIVIWLFIFGIAMAFFPIRPFWNDEWRLIYNIKFKTIPQLWGRLDLLQECPRVYLSLLKIISSTFDYSYISLRLPPLIIGLLSILLIFNLKKKILTTNRVIDYLFILILVSSQTFTDYLTQVKQYEMDIFLSLLVLWQFYELKEMSYTGKISIKKYTLICISFLVVPYLSYIYPICLAPLYPIFLLIIYKKTKAKTMDNKTILLIIVPLLLAFVSIIIFYCVDIKNVMANKSMYLSYKKSYYHSSNETIWGDIWNLFALVGSGLLFEIIFGALGLIAFIYNIIYLLKAKFNNYKLNHYIIIYALILIVEVIILFFTGKLIGGVARLTAYTVPSISLLIIYFINDLKKQFQFEKASNIVAGILFLGLFGNLISTCINSFTYEAYQQRIQTYWNTGQALKEARLRKIPILVTDGVCGDPWLEAPAQPGKLLHYTIDKKQIEGVDGLCAEAIVKVNPAYKVWDSIQIYYMPDAKWMKAYFLQLPKENKEAWVGDGLNYQLMHK